MHRLAAILGMAIGVATLLAACGGPPRDPEGADVIRELQRDIRKVGFAIRTTKTLIARARDADYLPDLYNRLAELYVEQARYHYQIALKGQKNKAGGVVSVQARLLKNQAVATYRRLLEAFPNYANTDKVMFFLGHELRELGEYDQMLKIYEQLADRFPRSEHRLEGLLVMGDYYFDKAQLDQAETYYQLILDSPESRVHAMAAYKLAWCRVNRPDFKGALAAFERSIRAANRFLSQEGQSQEGSKIDLRRESLVDSVYCFTEVHKPDVALGYFRQRADSKTTYVAALEKLGNRYYVKQDWKATAMVYREILSLTGNAEDTVEYGHRLYEAIRVGKIYDQSADDVAALIRVIRRRYHDPTLAEKTRRALHENFEKYSRDIATRLHDVANQRQREETYLAAANAYQSYLSFYRSHANALAVTSNLAEVLYAAKQYLPAAQSYVASAKKLKGKERKEAIYTAIASYFSALTGREQLGYLAREQARAGLRRAGALYLAEFGKDPKVKEVKFNIARTYYDAGQYDDAIRLFSALVDEFTAAEEATIAAHLVLDAYRNKEDYEGLIDAGKRFVSLGGLGDAGFKSEVSAIVRGAEESLLRAETISAADTREGGLTKLEELAEKYKGTALGKKALINAFVTARNANDPEKIFESGEKLVGAYPETKEVPDILATMGRVALDTLQYARGATYLEAAAERRSGAAATKLTKAACEIRIRLGERDEAERDLNILLRSGLTAQQKADLAVGIARLHVQADDWASVTRVLKAAEKAGATSAQLAYLLGYAFYRQDKLRPAQNAFVQAVGTGSGRQGAEREAAAAGQFYLAEIAFRTFSAIALPDDLNKLGEALQQKIAALAQTRDSYTQVVALGSPVWSVAALGRLASVDNEAATDLRNLSMPASLPDEVTAQVREALEAQAAPLVEEAKEAIKQCAQTAKKFTVLSAAAKVCLAGQAPGGDPQAELTVPRINRETPDGAAPLQRRLALSPNNVESITELGGLYLRSGNLYLARMIWGKGLEVDENATLLNLLGVATARLGDHTEAFALFKRATKLRANALEPRVNRTFLLITFGHGQLAKKSAKGLRSRIGGLSGDDIGLLPSALATVEGMKP